MGQPNHPNPLPIPFPRRGLRALSPTPATRRLTPFSAYRDFLLNNATRISTLRAAMMEKPFPPSCEPPHPIPHRPPNASQTRFYAHFQRENSLLTPSSIFLTPNAHPPLRLARPLEDLRKKFKKGLKKKKKSSRAPPAAPSNTTSPPRTTVRYKSLSSQRYAQNQGDRR